MPTPDEITHLLATMANALAALAIAWHLAIAVALIAVVRGWRPSARFACILLVAPIISVAISSFVFGNTFNGTSFIVLAFLLAVLGEGLTQARIERGPSWSTWIAMAAMTFGLVYPHFVTGPWYRALGAAPIGIVPCPTLAFVAGAVLLAGGFRSRAIPALLAVWIAFYAWFGIVKLGVIVDVGLLVVLVGLAAISYAQPLRGQLKCLTAYSVRRSSSRASG